VIGQANAGDSRVVMSVKGEAKPLSDDHKPTSWGKVICSSDPCVLNVRDIGEKARILSAGGRVVGYRINGMYTFAISIASPCSLTDNQVMLRSHDQLAIFASRDIPTFLQSIR
jgi:hypothetical protein